MSLLESAGFEHWEPAGIEKAACEADPVRDGLLDITSGCIRRRPPCHRVLAFCPAPRTGTLTA